MKIKKTVKIAVSSAIFFQNHWKMALSHYLSPNEKTALINNYAKGAGLSIRQLWHKCKVLKGAVYYMLLWKEEYKEDFQSNANKSNKRNLQDEIGHKTD